MGKLWTPWRLPYILSDKSSMDCVFCVARDAAGDAEVLVLYRGSRAFVLLNRYPYNNAHLMVAPYQHSASLALLEAATRAEIMELGSLSEQLLREAYAPDGLNLGLNLGSAAGAGIEEHLHLHVVPRWGGDTNFMAALNDVRIIPERLDDSYRRLRPLFDRHAARP
jgi:ATP adenylyltransferase